MKMTAEIIAAATQGTLMQPGELGRSCTDTRAIQSNDWFLALRGARFDAHEFLESAIAAAVADRRLLVIKFYSASCRTCLSIKGLYESAAEGPLGERAHFYEVDTSWARVLCSLANIKKTPVRHTQCQRNPLG